MCPTACHFEIHPTALGNTLSLSLQFCLIRPQLFWIIPFKVKGVPLFLKLLKYHLSKERFLRSLISFSFGGRRAGVSGACLQGGAEGHPKYTYQLTYHPTEVLLQPCRLSQFGTPTIYRY